MKFRSPTYRPRVDGKCERDCVLVRTGVFILGLLLGAFIGYQCAVSFTSTAYRTTPAEMSWERAEEARG